MPQTNETENSSRSGNVANYNQEFFRSDFGKIRDPLHDTIPISEAEKMVIDTFEFQRLRRIHQTAFIRYVFPGATHTRFEHSLGAMHLSGLFLSRLIENQRRIVEEHEKALVDIPSPLREAYALSEEIHGSLRETKNVLGVLADMRTVQSLRFAALLHDIGHAPFSHSSERFMPTWDQLEEALTDPSLANQFPDFLKAAFLKKIEKQKSRPALFVAKRIRHEV